MWYKAEYTAPSENRIYYSNAIVQGNPLLNITPRRRSSAYKWERDWRKKPLEALTYNELDEIIYWRF